MMLDINTLKEVARSIMPYGSNRVAVKPIDVEIKKSDIMASFSGVKPYKFVLEKSDGILYYPLVPFVSAVYYFRPTETNKVITERFKFAPVTLPEGILTVDFFLSDLNFNSVAPYGAPSNGVCDIATMSPRFVDSIEFVYEPVVMAAPPIVGVGVGHYPILKFVVE